MKETSHPHYGEVITDANGLIACHICGRSFVKLGSHIVQKHNMTSEQYKMKFGLDKGCGLITPEHREILRNNALQHYEESIRNNLIELGKPSRYINGHPGRKRDKVSEQTFRRLSILHTYNRR